MTYKLGDYICNGWGCYGIYDTDSVIGKFSNKEWNIFEWDIISEPLIGDAGGYENFIINKGFAERVVKILNSLEESE